MKYNNQKKLKPEEMKMLLTMMINKIPEEQIKVIFENSQNYLEKYKEFLNDKEKFDMFCQVSEIKGEGSNNEVQVTGDVDGLGDSS